MSNSDDLRDALLDCDRRERFPKCATCRHWLEHPPNQTFMERDLGLGGCVLIGVGNTQLAEASEDGLFLVRKDFGCVLHEAKK